MVGWSMIQLDIKSTYLNGDLDEEIYMRQPPDLVKRFRSGIKQCFTITDSGEIAWLFGIEVVYNLNAGTVCIAQRTVIDAVVRALYLEGVKPATRLLTGVRMCMYIAVTSHPDIAYAVHRLMKYMANPGWAHWEALKRGLTGYANADWGTSDDT
ncbi:hypothetical protein GSI_01974 [Ganoderma sinense ZZ0214-1]|uniref:Reverse transcriptase Ty1/copia-type domain-containing protein n=1 Tax=Ganoderma sinense ZZ0214-1 TaxID=1077348 RepID=A0A2G8SRA0_9APHY|nr:hypothetical protein GSI_01974 [Ganoderma sinense ZZ0214-1]